MVSGSYQINFGFDCQYRCNCKDPNDICYPVYGYCFSGCRQGWHGPGCIVGKDELNPTLQIQNVTCPKQEAKWSRNWQDQNVELLKVFQNEGCHIVSLAQLYVMVRRLSNGCVHSYVWALCINAHAHPYTTHKHLTYSKLLQTKPFGSLLTNTCGCVNLAMWHTSFTKTSIV